jgi:hypothetical protein
MTEPYKKVGRGGAGNFYSKKGIEDVSKAAASVFCLLCFSSLLSIFSLF